MSYADEYRNCVWTAFPQLERFMQDVFVRLGTPEDEARTIADVLISADHKGIDSHGIGRLKPIYIDRIDQGILSPTTRIDNKPSRSLGCGLNDNVHGFAYSSPRW